MRLARTQPTWGLGFADEVWWSRLVQPEQHRWIEEGNIPRLYARACGQEDTEPKALACYGLLLRCSPRPRRPDVAPVCGGPSGECSDHCVPHLVQ